MKPTNPLFSDKYINSKFQQLELLKIENLSQKLDIIRSWQKSIKNNAIIQSKEESLQGNFLQQFFVDVLNYSNQKDTGTWFLETEQKAADGKKMDGALGFFTINDKIIHADVRVVIELKNAKTDLDKPQTRKNDNRTPVQQAFDYANSLGGTCRWIIVSNFLEIRLYYQTDRTRYQVFDISTLDKEDKFKQFYFLLNKARLINQTGDSITDKLYSERQAEEIEISKKFYADYKQARLTFFQSLKAYNPSIDELILLTKTQKLLDRLLFIHFCEDYNIIDTYTLRNLIDSAKQDVWNRDTNKIYRCIVALFSAINDGYPELRINKFNGGLFADDEIFNHLMIDDAILKPVLALVDYDLASDLNVNILGHIFEQSISDIEELKADISGENFDKKQGKRKKDGIYYTPDTITRYIVEEAIGGWLKDKRTELNEADLPELNDADLVSIRIVASGKNKGKFECNAAIQSHLDFYDAYKEILSTIKVLDPACGSGAFLNQAFDFLYIEGQRVNKELVRLRAGQMSSFDLDKQILENNLFGVDLNQESVEITKLSLWLKTANRYNPLTSLDNNIKCGNSLIDDVAVAGDKAFVWELEFKAVMDNGGFDVVIGNPPYGAKFSKESQDFLLKYYDLGTTETAAIFIKKTFFLLNKYGRIGFIIPKAFSFSSNYKNIRNYVWDSVSHIVDCGKVWKEVLLEQVIILATKEKIYNYYSSLKKCDNELLFIDSINKNKARNFGFFLNAISNNEITIADKINSTNLYLNDISKNQRGAMLQQFIKDTGTIEVIGGNDINKFGICSIKGKIKDGNSIEQSFIKENSVLVQNIVAHIENPVDHIKIIACIPDKNFLLLDTINQISVNEPYSSSYVWCLLNSKLINWYLYRFVYAKAIRTMHFDNGVTAKIPVAELSEEKQQPFIIKADIMLEQNKNLQQLQAAFLSFIQADLKPQKLSNKLQRYYDLSWDDFKTELKKSKVDLNKTHSLNKVREWQVLFEYEKQQALVIKTLIDQTDKEIDNMVYELYGLTAEDIAIIETN
jgi:hypothetical protein